MALSAIACGGSSGKGAAPEAALARSALAQDGFHKILQAWQRGSHAERAALEPSLETFRAQYPTDGLARLAGSLAAWGLLERGELDRADAMAKKIEAEGAGTTYDIARTVEGAVQRRRGNAEAALAILEPLISKLIDGYARDLLNEEVVLSAVAAKRYPRALELMGVWLRETEEDQTALAAKLSELVAQVPPEELAKMLDKKAPIEGDDEGTRGSKKVTLRRIVALRLADVAAQTKDTRLAQRLLTTAGALLGEKGDAIAALAAGVSKARVDARTVGLLLSLRGPPMIKERGADVAAGVADGLGLPGSAARLVSRDDGGTLDRMNDALGSLASDGASIVIAGLDPETSAVAARFAEANKLPVILLYPAPIAADAKFAFSLGEDPAGVEKLLVDALASRGVKPLGLLDDGDGRIDVPGVEVHRCTDSNPSKEKLGGVVMGTSHVCARALGGLSLLPKAKLGVSFDSFGIALPAGSVIASAGLFPVDDDAPPPAMKRWFDERHGSPQFWSALGHDAAVLAYAAVQGLAERGTEDPKEVLERRTAAAAALETAKAELWTTDATGFAGVHVIARKVAVRDAKSE